MSNFVFLHVGEEPNVELFVRSIQLTNPGSRIIQCSDNNTKQIDGVSDVFRLDTDAKNLMTFRLQAFADLRLREPAIYLDTDMLVLGKIEPDRLLENHEVACCERSFGRDGLINTSFKGMDLSEYTGKTLGEIYPVLACFTITKSSIFWETCFEYLLALDKKFHWWYGDQEAMRDVVKNKVFATCRLPESHVACLPEFATNDKPPICLHFKGPQRKAHMGRIFEQIFAA